MEEESGKKIEEREAFRASELERQGAREKKREPVRDDEDRARGNTQRELALGTRARASESAPYTPPRDS